MLYLLYYKLAKSYYCLMLGLAIILRYLLKSYCVLLHGIEFSYDFNCKEGVGKGGINQGK